MVRFYYQWWVEVVKSVRVCVKPNAEQLKSLEGPLADLNCFLGWHGSGKAARMGKQAQPAAEVFLLTTMRLLQSSKTHLV